MATCHICLDDLSFPVSLPCGHIFCSECIRRAVDAIKPYSSLHACPTCRSLYTVAPIDPSVVPSHLRAHLTPSIRKVYLDQPPRDTAQTSTSAAPADVEIARLRAENSALRTNCSMWRRRAEVHGAATLGLLELARTARDQAIQVSRERDDLHRRHTALKRRFDEEESLLHTYSLFSSPIAGPSSRPSESIGCHGQNLPPRTEEPVSVSVEFSCPQQIPSATLQYLPPTDHTDELSEPPRKRTKTEAPASESLPSTHRMSESNISNQTGAAHSHPHRSSRLLRSL